MVDLNVAQDPSELFDIVTADGAVTGVRKARAEVHRDGDWHRAIHVWVTGLMDGVPFLMFQQRSLAKDTQPGKLDATVGGHVRAGEALDQTVREVEEEIGIAVTLADLHYAGTRICAHEGERGIIDRELQDVFFLRDERPLTEYRPHPHELAALVRFPLDGLLDFLSGATETVRGEAIATGEAFVRQVEFDRSAMIVRIDRYAYRVAVAAAAFLRGDAHFSV